MSASPCAPRQPPLSVVFADDVVEIQRLVADWLTAVGYDVRCASTGYEALRLIRQRPPDVVVTDIIMPECDGLQVIAEGRRLHPRMCMLAISGGSAHLKAYDCLKLARSLGAHAVLMKPFTGEQLLEAIDTARSLARRPGRTSPRLPFAGVA